MQVSVVNVRKFPVRPPLPYIYVGRRGYGKHAALRQHPLANPFVIEPGQPRGMTLDRYREWLDGMDPRRRDGLLNCLATEVALLKLPLGCWCAPAACHADILAERIQPIVDRILGLGHEPVNEPEASATKGIQT